MRNKAILFSSLILISSAALAEPNLLKDVAKQAAKDAAKAVAPTALDKTTGEVKQTLENAEKLKKGVENAPDAVKKDLKETVKESVNKQIEQATPEEIKKAEETLKAGKSLKGKVDSTRAVNKKAQEKATEKALDLLR